MNRFLFDTDVIIDYLRGNKPAIEYFLSLFDIIPVSKEIATEGGQMRQKWHKSHGTGLADALIAATATTNSLTLISLNKEHFGMLEALHVPYRK